MTQKNPSTTLSNVFIIINPNSGAQRPGFWWARRMLGIKDIKKYESKEVLMGTILEIFKQHNIDANGAFTEAPGHATELAKQAVNNGVDAVVAVGGDGTINEVVNGMANTSVMLGVVPYGTANVFGLSFNIPMDIEAACLKIINGQRQSIDLGRINGTYFACMSGIGFDAFVIQKADKSLKKAVGALSYVLIAIWEILRYRFYPILFTLDNSMTPRKAYFLIISNTKYYGGDMVIAPNANPCDGKLDACIFSGRGLFKTLWVGVQMKLGKIKNTKDVEVIQCNSIRIRRFGEHSIHADAEYIGQSPAKITIAKKALLIAT